MTYELTNEDKTGVINQHLKTLSYNKFNLDLSKIEESAKASPDAAVITDLTAQTTEVTAKINALLAELDKLK
jgi:hypothetical protein